MSPAEDEFNPKEIPLKVAELELAIENPGDGIVVPGAETGAPWARKPEASVGAAALVAWLVGGGADTADAGGALDGLVTTLPFKVTPSTGTAELT